MAGTALEFIGRTNRHELGGNALDCCETEFASSMIVTLSPACKAEAAKIKGSIALVGSVGP